MDAVLNQIVGPWAQLGIVGTVVLALAVANIVQWRRAESLQRTIDQLHDARLADRDRHADRIADLLVKSLDTSNRVSDGMEAMERIFEKVKP
jgi:hypothetical protein